MRVMQVVVSTDGFRTEPGNACRSAVFANLLEEAVDRQSDLLLLPGGYWTVPRKVDIEPLLERISKKLRQAAKKQKVWIIAGIDLAAAKQAKSKTTSKHHRKGALPYFAFAMSPTGKRLGLWQQLTTTSANAVRVKKLNVAERTVDVNGNKVLALICGEMHNKYFRESLKGQGLDLICVCGHSGFTRVLRSITAISQRSHCPVLHVQHLRTWGTTLIQMVSGRGSPDQKQVAANRCIYKTGSPWVSRCVRRI